MAKIINIFKQFCEGNISLIIIIAQKHPEYFVHEEIVSYFIKAFPNNLQCLKRLIEPQIQITPSIKTEGKK